MKLFRTSALWAALAASVGVFVLLGYFVDFDFIQNIRLLFMQWAALLAAAALLVGLANLVQVHWRKLSQTEEGWIYSAVLILAFLVTLILALSYGPDSTVALYIFEHLQLPLEAGLMALLSVTLLVAGFRLVTRRRDAFSILFLATAILVMIGTGPALGGTEGPATVVMRDLRAWISQVWSAGGARGIALGVALGATTTGLRVLLGADRPYGS
ncbi:MAG: hypothetical protein ACE5JF_05510 [Anaerolineales bacterium]